MPEEGQMAYGELDWDRRYLLMRTHTALHILSAIAYTDYGATVTGGNMEPGEGRLDFEIANFTPAVAEGMIHAEARINDAGVWLLEIAPRGIGGLCGRVLDATLGMTSAEIVLRHAAGLPLPAPAGKAAAGVMMIPVPARGILQGIDGLDAALSETLA